MSARRVYKCDLCRDEVKAPERCFGLNFRDMKNFKLADPAATDGTHICFGCLKQLEAQIPESQASVTYSPANPEGNAK
jgi:hypothetical protein